MPPRRIRRVWKNFWKKGNPSSRASLAVSSARPIRMWRKLRQENSRRTTRHRNISITSEYSVGEAGFSETTH